MGQLFTEPNCSRRFAMVAIAIVVSHGWITWIMEVQGSRNMSTVQTSILLNYNKHDLQRGDSNPEHKWSQMRKVVDQTSLLGTEKAQMIEKISYSFCSFEYRNRTKGSCTRVLLGHRIPNSTLPSTWISDTSTPLVVIVHGLRNGEAAAFDEHREWGLAAEIINRKEDQERYNVVLMDWSSLSSYDYSYYDFAAEGAVSAGKDLQEFITDMKTRHCISNYLQVVFIGIGLGAHVSGIAGRQLKQQNQGIVHSIYGVDPTGPLFDTMWGNHGVEYAYAHISKNDALSVNVWHCSEGTFGSRKISGDKDFLVYGGWEQSSCGKDYQCSHRKCQEHFVRFVMHSVRVCPRPTKESVISGPQENMIATREFFGSRCMELKFNKNIHQWSNGVFDADLDNAYNQESGF